MVVTKQTDEELQAVLDEVGAEDMSELRDRFEEAFREEAEQTVEGLAEEDIESVFGGGVLDEAVEAKVDERFEWVLPEIRDTSRDRLRQTILEGLDEGINPRQIADKLNRDFDQFSQTRATRIARTEMLSASNAGTFTAHQESRVVEWRSWLHTRDPGNPNHRPGHLAADRKTQDNPVKVGEPFRVNGFSVMHPGDFGDPGEDCNCRCTTVAEFPERSGRTASEREKIWKQFDARLTDRERRTAETVRDIFERQRSRVLAAFSQAFDVQPEEVSA